MSSANLDEASPVSPGTRCVAGYFLEKSQLPPGWEGHDLDALVAEIHGTCSHIAPLTKQQALRLMLGLGYDRVAAVSKWREISAWRETNNLAYVRNQQAAVISGTDPICFPNEQDVYERLLRVCPCALRASNGAPVSVWHAKTLNASAVAELASTEISTWSHAVFEYKDLWISRQSEERKRLIGYIQVYDMQGVGLRQLTSRDIGEKLKCCLQPGGFYMEAVSHMYVVNASALFSMAWKASVCLGIRLGGRETERDREVSLCPCCLQFAVMGTTPQLMPFVLYAAAQCGGCMLFQILLTSDLFGRQSNCALLVSCRALLFRLHSACGLTPSSWLGDTEFMAR